jgi:hypothetical protein
MGSQSFIRSHEYTCLSDILSRRALGRSRFAHLAWVFACLPVLLDLLERFAFCFGHQAKGEDPGQHANGSNRRRIRCPS